MNTTKKLACIILVALAFSIVAATVALAANITFSNSFNFRMSVTLAYVDAQSGVMTTRGWWHVEPGGSTVISVNAVESEGIYYAAYNKNQYYDSSAYGASRIRRWASPRTFTNTTDDRLYDDGEWQGTYYRISGRSVQIDSNEIPSSGARRTAVRTEQYTTGTSTVDSGEENLEALGDRLSYEYFSDEELATFSKDTLNYLRNRIYANHGYNFLTQKWKEVFSRYNWYRPNPNFSEQLFNEYERLNLRRIMAEEKRR